MRAEIISIGEELLSGDTDIVDTNSVYIAKQLRAIGIHVAYKSTVGDNIERITEVLLNALGRVDVIITSGGLGPTVDDMTRDGVAAAINRKRTPHLQFVVVPQAAMGLDADAEEDEP